MGQGDVRRHVLERSSTMRHLIGTLMVLALAWPARADTKFSLSGDNTKIDFTGSKPDGKHEGGFKTLSGAATAAAADATGLKFEVEINTESLYTDTDKLTAHLKSPDFFSVKDNPTAKFVSSKVEKSDGGGYAVTGDLTLNGKTKTITFPARIELSNDKLALKSEFTINRTDFGMTYGKGKIHDDVKIKVAVDAKK
jgi:polyisoprenoid-binding protein YceI